MGEDLDDEDMEGFDSDDMETEDDDDEDDEEVESEEETPKLKKKPPPKLNGIPSKKEGKANTPASKPAAKGKPSGNKENVNSSKNVTPKGKNKDPPKGKNDKDTPKPTTPKRTPEELKTFLLKSPNLPKKYEKFSNFLKNNMKVTDPKSQKELWEYVQKNKK